MNSSMRSCDPQQAQQIRSEFRYLQSVVAEHRYTHLSSNRKRKRSPGGNNEVCKKAKTNLMSKRERMYMPIIPPQEYFDNLVKQDFAYTQRNEIRKKVDIFGSLAESGHYGIVRSICEYAQTDDIRNMKKVSISWRRIIDQLKFDGSKKFINDSRKGNEENHSPSSGVKRAYSAVKQNKKQEPSKKKRRPLSLISNIIKDSIPDPLESDKLSFELFGELYPDRDYKCIKCPKCRRASLEDTDYQQGKCGYKSCAHQFCTLCLSSYHPCRPCIEFNSYKKDPIPTPKSLLRRC